MTQTRNEIFSLKQEISSLLSYSKRMSKMYIERWHSAKQFLKCTLKPEAQRTKFSLLEGFPEAQQSILQMFEEQNSLR